MPQQPALQWIPLLPITELPEDLELMAHKWIAMEDGDPNFIQTVGHAPETLRKYIRWTSPMWRKGLIQHRIKELCRIRIANANDCPYCMNMRYETGRNQGIDTQLTDQLEDYEAGDFTDREKAAFNYTDEIYMDNITWDYQRVDPTVYQRLSDQFSEPEIVELTWAICVAIEYGRNFTAWGVPITEQKTVRPMSELSDSVSAKLNVDDATDAENRARLLEIWESEPDHAAALATLLARPDMLHPVLMYYRHVKDGGLLEPELKAAVRTKIRELARGGVVDGVAPGSVMSARIAAAVDWAEGMAVDFSQFVGNEQMLERMRQHFTTQEMVELGMFSGWNLILRRVGAVLGARVLPLNYGLAVSS
jgi:AhpD family alkylhydroperoxidase